MKVNDLDDLMLGRISSGNADPIYEMSVRDVIKKAKELGPERKDMGTWTQPGGIDLLTLHIRCRPREYAKHKSEFDEAINLLSLEVDEAH